MSASSSSRLPSLDTPHALRALQADVCARALDARDARFDGVFFVGILTTGVYCRPVCPARVSHRDRRRFFDSAAGAERAGFRPCLRCRPELAPGRALIDAVPRLADAAAQRIAAGALNGQSVADLARELGVSERHLRRALERELGVSPVELAQTHRLLLAKRLLADTRLSVTDVAFASGFQSLRRFNAAFRAQYRMPPSALRRSPRGARDAAAGQAPELLRLTLAYRAPLAWDVLLDLLGREAIPGVEAVQGRRYSRTVRLERRSGTVLVEDGGVARSTAVGHLNVDVSASLVPVLMPLLARLRRLFDLDAAPTVVDSHLEQEGLGALVRQRPGVRIPGALCGFEVALRVLLGGQSWRGTAAEAGLAHRVFQELGEPLETGSPALALLPPTAERVARAGAAGLMALGVPERRAVALAAVARGVTGGMLRLEPGHDAVAAHRTLMELDGIDEGLATTIVMRALHWPDAFPISDPVLQRAAGATGPVELQARAERWRPWRAYAALQLWLQDEG